MKFKIKRIFYSRISSVMDAEDYSYRSKVPVIFGRGQNTIVKKFKIKNAKGPNSKRDFKEAFENFLQTSSLYALNRIGNTTSIFLKLFWFIILLIGCVGCITQMSQFLSSYYSYPVVVNIETIHVQSNELFPGVTICNRNAIQREFEVCVLKNISYEKCRSSLPKLESEDKTVKTCSKEESNTTAFCTLENIAQLALNLDAESRLKYGHQRENFIQSCSFDQVPCSYEDFRVSSSSRYGNCFTFNFQEQKLHTNITGQMGGLQLIINIEQLKYSTFTSSSGIIAQVHDPYTVPDADREGIYVSPGFETDITNTKDLDSRLPPPYKDKCRLYDRGISQKMCKDGCLEKITLSECHCYLKPHDREDFPMCNITSPSVVSCMDRANEKFYSDFCDCPISCEEITYKLRVSSLTWPDKSSYVAVQSAENNVKNLLERYSIFKETHLKLKLHFDTFDYTLFKRSPMYINSELFSQIGGQIGLWLGLSLIFLFEIIEKIILFLKGH